MNLKKILLSILLLFSFLPSARSANITPKARRIIATIDSLNVEKNWPAGLHVNWETGVPDGIPEKGEGKHTHCSAFVAAAAKHLGIYILRPPDHEQKFLANAQFDWLSDEGARQGWKLLKTGGEAQDHANRGDLVVAVYKNHHDDKPGHIAIVRPDDKSPSEIESEGPEITQAGGHNYTSTSLKRGFADHPAAFGNNEVRYYAHAVDRAKS